MKRGKSVFSLSRLKDALGLGLLLAGLATARGETLLLGDQHITANSSANPAQEGNLDVDGSVAIGGTLSVEESAWFAGNQTFFGVLPNDPSKAGVVLKYDDPGDFPRVDWTVNSDGDGAYWNWNYTQTNGQVAQQMVLSGEEGNRLFIYDLNTGTVTINLAGDMTQTSSIKGNMDLYGQDNKMPNQTLTGEGSILTKGLGDGRYILQGSSLGLLGADAGDDFTFAVGELAKAMSMGAIAMGANVKASGTTSFAQGNGSEAQGNASAALGISTKATGTAQVVIGKYNSLENRPSFPAGNWLFEDTLFVVGNGSSPSQRSNALEIHKDGSAYFSKSISIGGGRALAGGSLAFGEDCEASGDFSMAQGCGFASGESSVALNSSSAEAPYSFAAGTDTIAQGKSQFVVGTFNIAEGGHTPAETEQLFIIGNGSHYNNRSNALVVKKNGDTTIYGKLAVTGKSQIRVAPAGDLSMGAFTQEPAP